MGNRDALLEAAGACIAERGYAHTTARDLVAASGTNLGAIGYHFGSKERLLNEALYAGFAEWLDEAAATLPIGDAGDPWGVVEAALGGFLGRLDSRRQLCVAFVEALAQAERAPELRAQMAAGYQRYRRAVARHLRAAVPRLTEVDAASLASLLIATFDGLLVQWLLDPAALPDAAALTASLRAATG